MGTSLLVRLSVSFGRFGRFVKSNMEQVENPEFASKSNESFDDQTFTQSIGSEEELDENFHPPEELDQQDGFELAGEEESIEERIECGGDGDKVIELHHSQSDHRDSGDEGDHQHHFHRHHNHLSNDENKEEDDEEVESSPPEQALESMKAEDPAKEDIELQIKEIFAATNDQKSQSVATKPGKKNEKITDDIDDILEATEELTTSA